MIKKRTLKTATDEGYTRRETVPSPARVNKSFGSFGEDAGDSSNGREPQSTWHRRSAKKESGLNLCSGLQGDSRGVA